MSETIDIEPNLNSRRGQTLKVVAILSWISIGLSAIMLLFSVMQGPQSVEELDHEKEMFLSKMDAKTIELLGEEYVTETMMIMDVSNDLFYSINGLSLANAVLGFYAVFLMYNLKKRGFYIYLVYSVVPIVSSLAFFGGGTIMIFATVFSIIVSLVFGLLYGYQLKRMS